MSSLSWCRNSTNVRRFAEFACLRLPLPLRLRLRLQLASAPIA